jgi:adenine specific DNA methylase Mod
MNKYNVYFGANEHRKTNLTRGEAIEHINFLNKELGKSKKDIHVYCSTRDFYVGDLNLFEFMDLNSVEAQMMYDDNASLLENDSIRGLKWNKDNVIYFTKDNQLIPSHSLIPSKIN